MARERSCYKFEGCDEMRCLVERGMNNLQIAEAMGISPRTVRKYKPLCGASSEHMNNANMATHRAAVQRVEKALEGTTLEYVSGPAKANSSATFRCKRCGHTFDRRVRAVVSMGRTYCAECREEERRARLEEERKPETVESVCVECGERFTYERIGRHKRFCGTGCRMAYHHRLHDRKRRVAPTDGGPRPTWRVLYKRGETTCHICGGLVDPEDFEIRGDGVFVAGPTFPSVDHYVALANGGLDGYSNAKMAHMRCNSLKSDKLEW